MHGVVDQFGTVMDIMRLIHIEYGQAKVSQCLGIVARGVEAFNSEIGRVF